MEPPIGQSPFRRIWSVFFILAELDVVVAAESPLLGVEESAEDLLVEQIILLIPQHLQVRKNIFCCFLLKYLLLQGVTWESPSCLRHIEQQFFLLNISFFSSADLFLSELQSEVQWLFSDLQREHLFWIVFWNPVLNCLVPGGSLPPFLWRPALSSSSDFLSDLLEEITLIYSVTSVRYSSSLAMNSYLSCGFRILRS